MSALRSRPAQPAGPPAAEDVNPVERRERRIGAAELAAVALVAGALACVVTWPLIGHLNRAAESPAADPRFQAWTLDWVQHALRHPLHLYDADIFTPARGTLAYSDPLIGVAVPLLPLRWLGLSPIGVYNAALLLGTSLSATAAYAFGRVVTRSIVVGAVTAATFSFSAFATLESTHVQTLFAPGVPAAAAIAWLLADHATDRRLRRYVVALAAVVAWQCSVSFYSGSYALAAAAAVLVVRSRDLGRRGARGAALALGMGAGAAAGLAVPYIAHASSLPGFHWSLADLAAEGADFRHADPRLLLSGSILGSRHAYPLSPPAMFPGVALLALAGLGLAVTWHRWRQTARATRLVLVTAVVLAVIGAVAAVGASNAGWRRWAPYRLVFAFVPGASALRATYRAWMIGLLGLGLLAGLGAQVLVRRARWVGSTGLVIVIILGAIVAEGYRHGRQLQPVTVHPVDHALAGLPPGGVLYLPVNTPDEPFPYTTLLRQADFVYRDTAGHRPIANGYAAFFPSSYFQLGSEVRSLPSPPALAALETIGVRYVVVPADGTAGIWAPLTDPATAAPLRLIRRDSHDVLYEVPAAPARR